MTIKSSLCPSPRSNLSQYSNSSKSLQQFKCESTIRIYNIKMDIEIETKLLREKSNVIVHHVVKNLKATKALKTYFHINQSKSFIIFFIFFVND